MQSHTVPVPLYRIWLSSDLVSGCFNVAAHSSLPVQGIDFIIGNDIARGKVMSVVHVTNTPLTNQQPDAFAKNFPYVFTASAVTTRTQSKHLVKENEMYLGKSVFADSFEKDAFSEPLDAPKPFTKSVVCPDPDIFLNISCEVFTEAQKSDPTLEKFCLSADIRMSLPCNHQFYWNNTLLMHSWNARLLSDENSDWNVVHYIVVPLKF